MLVSKIVPDESRFIVFGGADSGLKSLGWGWVRYCLTCSFTGEMIVFLARAFISLDSTGRFRPIYSPGSMSPGGWNYHVGVPEQLTVRGRNLEITLEGPSTVENATSRIPMVM